MIRNGTIETYTPAGWRLAKVADGEVIAMVVDVNRWAARAEMEKGAKSSERACTYEQVCRAQEALRKAGVRA